MTAFQAPKMTYRSHHKANDRGTRWSPYGTGPYWSDSLLATITTFRRWINNSRDISWPYLPSRTVLPEGGDHANGLSMVEDPSDERDRQR